MFGLYKQLLPELGGYLTHAGELSRTRLETFMGKLAEAEADVLQSRAEVGGALHAVGRMHCFLSCVSHCATAAFYAALCSSFQFKQQISHVGMSAHPPLAHLPSPPCPLPLQDTEAFEAKRSRGGRGGEPAWASERAGAKRSAEEAKRAQQGGADELDEDDAFAVGGAQVALCEASSLGLLGAVH